MKRKLTKKERDAREKILAEFREFNRPIHEAMDEMKKYTKAQKSSSGSHLESWAYNRGGMGWGR